MSQPPFQNHFQQPPPGVNYPFPVTPFQGTGAPGMDVDFNPGFLGIPSFIQAPPGFPLPMMHIPQPNGHGVSPTPGGGVPETPAILQEPPPPDAIPLNYPHGMTVYLPSGSQQQLAKYSKLVLMKHSAPIPNQASYISFSPFYIRIDYEFPHLDMDLVRSSLAVKLGNTQLAIRFQNNEIEIRKEKHDNRSLILLVKEHSILLPSHDSWKKLNPRADGIKLNVQLFVKKLRPLEVSFVVDHNMYTFSTPVICCAQTSFQNALKCYRDNDANIKELQQWIDNLQTIHPTTIRIRSAESAFVEQEAQLAPTKKRKLPTEYKSPGPLYEWYHASPSTNTIESFFTFHQALWSSLLQKNWEGIIKFFHNSIGDPSTEKIINEITSLFTADYLTMNIYHTCSSHYFGGFLDPKRVVLLMKLKMMEEPDTFRANYPDGCVIFVIWKNEKEKLYYYYLIESPYWNPIENKWVQTSQGHHRDTKFPCSIRKFQLLGNQQLHLVSSKAGQKLATMTISYISECWGGQQGKTPSLPVFQFTEEDWGQKSSEFLGSIIEPRSWNAFSPPVNDGMIQDHLGAGHHHHPVTIKQEPGGMDGIGYLFQSQGADWEAGSIENLDTDMNLGDSGNMPPGPFYPVDPSSFSDQDGIPDISTFENQYDPR